MKGLAVDVALDLSVAFDLPPLERLMKLVERARGRWHEILTGIGVPETVLDGKHHACPACGGRDRFRFTRDDNGGFFCASLRGDGVALVQHVFGEDFRAAAKRIETVIGKGAWTPSRREKTYADTLLATAKPSARSAYLSSRGLEVAPGLQFARAVEYRDHDGNPGGTFDAMLAPVTRAGKFLTYHCTYLSRGRKAPVEVVRKILPAHGSLSGAGVELYPSAEVMGVAEGIETAIAAKVLHGMPVHAALNTSLLAKWEPPSVARVIHIFGDNDANAAGQAAAWQLCHRLRMKGIEARVVLPSDTDTDWNDVLLSQARAAA